MLPVKRMRCVKGLDKYTLKDTIFAMPFCAYMMYYLLKELAATAWVCDTVAYKTICHS